MEFLFGRRKTPAEMLRQNQRALNKAMRELDRLAIFIHLYLITSYYGLLGLLCNLIYLFICWRWESVM